MKSAALLLGIACSVFFSTTLLAQLHGSCGFDVKHNNLLQTVPAYRSAVEKQESNALRYRQDIEKNQDPSLRIAGSTYIMPVVVHIVHTGGLTGSIYNPSDADIQNAIAYLNAVYNGTDPGQNGEGVGVTDLQFELAKRDPNCNPTNGINHVNGSSLSGYAAHGLNLNNTNGSPELSVKNLIRWDPSKYCNIWVVNKIDDIDGQSGGGVAGFAYFPFDPSVDGVVIRAADMRAGNITLPHEMGHVFTLYHPFEGSNGSICPPNTNPLTQGDRLADTDPVTNPDFAPDRTGAVNPCVAPTTYKIETEHNIMNYVSVPRLFTTDQKQRMLAAITSGIYGTYRAGQIGSGGDIAPDQGTPCEPKINFELDEYRVTEITAGTVTVDGCNRNYKDYTFAVLIGKAPSAAATITLAGSGAIEKVNYDITTNGSFTSPSKTIVFPVGSTAPHTFTARVYDDAIVSGPVTLTIAFTLNSGTGDAVIGNGRPTLTLYVADNDVLPTGPFNSNVSLNGSYNYTSDIPFFARSTSLLKSQFIYKASELRAQGIAAGIITGITMNIIKRGGAAFSYKGLTIKMGQTNLPALFKFTSPTGGSGVNDAAHTTVFSSDYTTVDGANAFNFTNNFVWDGTSNIVVTMCYNNGATLDTQNDGVTIYSDDYSADSSSFLYQYSGCATAIASVTFGYYGNNYKPVITFQHTTPATPVATALNTSRSEYLGPNASVYFYSQASSELLAKIENLSSFDYGCTQVIIDRAGISASAFRSNTNALKLMDKTFRVVPQQNNPSGAYKLTLYYTQPEVTGWESATLNSFNDIQFVKVPGQILNVTPAAPDAEGTPQLVIPTERGNIGTSYSLAATFNNGFSGFGAGMASAVLPVRLLDISGRRVGDDVIISWSTAAEYNSRSFEIERSYTGTGFEKIGTVPAKGNSQALNRYEYKDADNRQDINYYRLRQTDIDGRWEYSKVISVQSVSGNQALAVVNPIRDNLDLRFGDIKTGAGEIRLLNASGQAVLRWKGMLFSGQHLMIPLDIHLANGVYTVQVLQDRQQLIRKLIRQ